MASDDQQRILITQAMPGLVLATAVKTPNGGVLCGSGTTLSDDLIQKMMVRGIKRIIVQGNPVPGRSQEPLSERLKELHHRFSRVHHVPFMALLERTIEREISKRS